MAKRRKHKIVYVYAGSGKTLDWSALRTQVLKRDSYKCQMCGTRGDLEAHHIKPRAAGGADTLTNLIALCPRCHDIAEEQGLTTPRLIRNWCPAEDVAERARPTEPPNHETTLAPAPADRLSFFRLVPPASEIEEPPIYTPNRDLPVLFEDLEFV